MFATFAHPCHSGHGSQLPTVFIVLLFWTTRCARGWGRSQQINQKKTQHARGKASATQYVLKLLAQHWSHASQNASDTQKHEKKEVMSSSFVPRIALGERQTDGNGISVVNEHHITSTKLAPNKKKPEFKHIKCKMALRSLFVWTSSSWTKLRAEANCIHSCFVVGFRFTFETLIHFPLVLLDLLSTLPSHLSRFEKKSSLNFELLHLHALSKKSSIFGFFFTA